MGGRHIGWRTTLLGVVAHRIDDDQFMRSNDNNDRPLPLKRMFKSVMHQVINRDRKSLRVPDDTRVLLRIDTLVITGG